MAETAILDLNTHSKILVIIGLLIAYIIASFTALCLGDENLNPKELFSYIFSQDEILRQIIIDGRLPRIVMAILISMLLASSGGGYYSKCIFKSYSRSLYHRYSFLQQPLVQFWRIC